MNDEINYRNNPLHGVSLKSLLIEMVDHYGFEILFAYLNINCFRTNPSIDSSVRFLKKTDWAREKIEAFYLYEFNNLPAASAEQYELPPRDRLIPDNQSPGEPAQLSLEDAERLWEKRAEKYAKRGRKPERSPVSSGSPGTPRGRKYPNNRDDITRNNDRDPKNPPAGRPVENESDPWAKWRK